MSCSNYCHQGRLPCPTPWTCGHADKANYEMPIQFVGREPEEAPVTPSKDVAKWVAVCAIAVIFAALMLPNLVLEQWPRLVSLMGSV